MGQTEKIKNLKEGDVFTLKNYGEAKESQVYVRGKYDRASKTYSCYKWEDIAKERFFKGDKEVWIDFYF